jgi:vacuolar-type H+-ATPase subunit I/STV1
MNKGTQSALPTGPEESAGGGKDWFWFWIALFAPLVVGWFTDFMGQFDWTARLNMSLVVGVILIVLGCSLYCAVRLVVRYCETPSLRVFLGSGLALLLATGYLFVLVVLHYITVGIEPGA